MIKNQKLGGILAIIIGAGFIGLAFYGASSSQKVYYYPVFLGPPILLLGVAMLIFTKEKLFINNPAEPNRPKLTPTAWVFVGVGLILGGGLFAALWQGWF